MIISSSSSGMLSAPMAMQIYQLLKIRECFRITDCRIYAPSGRCTQRSQCPSHLYAYGCLKQESSESRLRLFVSGSSRGQPPRRAHRRSEAPVARARAHGSLWLQRFRSLPLLQHFPYCPLLVSGSGCVYVHYPRTSVNTAYKVQTPRLPSDQRGLSQTYRVASSSCCHWSPYFKLQVPALISSIPQMFT